MLINNNEKDITTELNGRKPGPSYKPLTVKQFGFQDVQVEQTVQPIDYELIHLTD